MISPMPLAELQRIAESVEARHGWDFSRVCEDRDPVPWDYMEVVRHYLRPDHRVLDVGTGGGEKFMALAPYYGSGVGVDASAQMIGDALQNRPPELAEKVAFHVMRAEDLQFSASSFDVVLNRHSVVDAPEVVRVLRPEGVFINQQVGARNTANICAIFGCGPGGEYAFDPDQDVMKLAESFRGAGCVIIAQATYDVRYFFQDVESFVFWLKAIPMPEDFTIERHWQQVDQIIAAYAGPRGIETNEHRELLIVRKP